MKIYTINEIVGSVGMVVPVMDLTFKKIWPVGSNPKAPIKGVVTDGQTEMNFALWIKGKVNEGSRYMVHSIMGKSGLAGLQVKQNDYNGKVTIELHIDRTARIEPFGAQPQTPTQTQKPQQNAPQRQPEAFNAQSDVDVDAKIAQYGALYHKCLKEASLLRIKSKHDPEFTFAVMKDIASCYFIQAVRDGLLNHLENEHQKTKGGVGDHPDHENQEDDTKSDNDIF